MKLLAGQGKTEDKQKTAGRVEKWDILRGGLIYLVILGHLCARITTRSGKTHVLFLFIYSFHMPLFIFISGLLSKRSINEKKYERIFQYLVLYLLAKIIKGVPNWILGHSVSFSLFSEGGSPWYMLAMAAFIPITIFLRKYDRRWVFGISVLAACLVGYDENIGDFLTASRIFTFYPFFFAGYCLDAENLRKRLSSGKIKAVSAVFLAALVIFLLKYTDNIYFIRRLLVGRYPYSRFADYGGDAYILYGGVIRLLYYAAAFLECFALISVTPERCRLLAWFGRRTLPVYMFHHLGIFVWDKLLNMNEVMDACGAPRYDIVLASFLITCVFSLPVFVKIMDKCMKLCQPKAPGSEI